MMKTPVTSKDAADKRIKSIRRKTRQTYAAEEKIRIGMAGLRGVGKQHGPVSAQGYYRKPV
ncbi:MAG: hypothetical protein RIR95_1586 [Pseudomonadota bacterium]